MLAHRAGPLKKAVLLGSQTTCQTGALHSGLNLVDHYANVLTSRFDALDATEKVAA